MLDTLCRAAVAVGMKPIFFLSLVPAFILALGFILFFLLQWSNTLTKAQSAIVKAWRQDSGVADHITSAAGSTQLTFCFLHSSEPGLGNFCVHLGWAFLIGYSNQDNCSQSYLLKGLSTSDSRPCLVDNQ